MSVQEDSDSGPGRAQTALSRFLSTATPVSSGNGGHAATSAGRCVLSRCDDTRCTYEMSCYTRCAPSLRCSPPGCAASAADVRLPQPQQHISPHRLAGRTVPAVLRPRPCCRPRRPAARSSACAAPVAVPQDSAGRSAVNAPERLVAGVFSLWRGMLQWWGESCSRAAEVTRQAEAQQVCCCVC